MKRTAYKIFSKPTGIGFTCPNCDENVPLSIRWIRNFTTEENPFELEEAICPECNRIVKMGEWSYD